MNFEFTAEQYQSSDSVCRLARDHLAAGVLKRAHDLHLHFNDCRARVPLDEPQLFRHVWWRSSVERSETMASANPAGPVARLTPHEEASFFSSLRLFNGTFKTTQDHRMDDLNAFVIAHWRDAKSAPAQILDIGVSSGISTLEWLDAMTASGLRVEMTATDLVLSANLVRLWPGIEVLERSGLVLQHVVFGWPLRPWRRRLDFLSGYVVLNLLANSTARWRLRRLDVQKRSSSVVLLSPRAMQCKDVTWMEQDILDRPSNYLQNRFDVVRAANILNREYFSEAKLRCAVSNIKTFLKNSGLLIVNRTHANNSNHATLFELTNDGQFSLIARFGRGSEIEDIVLST